jgi:hypothetical protein
MSYLISYERQTGIIQAVESDAKRDHFFEGCFYDNWIFTKKPDAENKILELTLLSMKKHSEMCGKALDKLRKMRG